MLKNSLVLKTFSNRHFKVAFICGIKHVFRYCLFKSHVTSVNMKLSNLDVFLCIFWQFSQTPTDSQNLSVSNSEWHPFLRVLVKYHREL